jgi:hypothetical protein
MASKGITEQAVLHETADSDYLLSADEVERQIAEYEALFGMSSDEFVRLRQAGNAPDTFETMHWFILLRNK